MSLPMYQPPTQPQPLAPIDQLRAQIASLDAKLVKVHPQHKALLMQIHKMIHQDEQLMYLVTPEEVGKIVTSLQELAGQKILEQKVKAAKAKGNKGLSQISIDDI